MEDFFHHREALVRAKLVDRREVNGHRLLRVQVDGVILDHRPCCVEVFDVHDEEQKLVSAKDGIFPDSGPLQQVEHLRPYRTVGLNRRLVPRLYSGVKGTRLDAYFFLHYCAGVVSISVTRPMMPDDSGWRVCIS